MKIEIYENEEILNFDNVFITKFEDSIESKMKEINDYVIDFQSIKELKGEKTLMELAFQHEKKEQL